MMIHTHQHSLCAQPVLLLELLETLLPPPPSPGKLRRERVRAVLQRSLCAQPVLLLEGINISILSMQGLGKDLSILNCLLRNLVYIEIDVLSELTT